MRATIDGNEAAASLPSTIDIFLLIAFSEAYGRMFKKMVGRAEGESNGKNVQKSTNTARAKSRGEL